MSIQGTMVDTWASVGSCAQIGKNVHLSGGVGIGGVLEPMQAGPDHHRGQLLHRRALGSGRRLHRARGRGARHGRLHRQVDQDRRPRHRPGHLWRGSRQLLVVVAGTDARKTFPQRRTRPQPLLRRHRQARRRPDQRRRPRSTSFCGIDRVEPQRLLWLFFSFSAGSTAGSSASRACSSISSGPIRSTGW